MYNKVLEKIGSMVEEDLQAQGAPDVNSGGMQSSSHGIQSSSQTPLGAPVLEKERGQEELYQESGCGSSGKPLGRSERRSHGSAS